MLPINDLNTEESDLQASNFIYLSFLLSGKLLGHLFTLVELAVNEKDQQLVSLSTARVSTSIRTHTNTHTQIITRNLEALSVLMLCAPSNRWRSSIFVFCPFSRETYWHKLRKVY